MGVKDRFTWATAILDIASDDRILEIGCGAGLFAEQIVKHLDQGSITAIDRSAAMIKLASKKNAAGVAAGRANFLHLDFVESAFNKNQFDKIVAFNVNFFWKKPKEEFRIIKQIMKPTGQLYIFYQAPTWLREEATQPIKKNLEENYLEVTHSFVEKMNPTPVFCIQARHNK